MIDDPYENALEHFGVKGMRWGIRKKEETGSKASTSNNKESKSTGKANKEETAAKVSGGTGKESKTGRKTENAEELNAKWQKVVTSKKTPKLKTSEQLENIAENKKKFKAKFDFDEEGPEAQKTTPKKGRKLTEKQKKTLIKGAIFAGVLIGYAGAVYAENRMDKKVSIKVQNEALDNLDIFSKKKPIFKPTPPGDPITAGLFNQACSHSISKSWGFKNTFLTKESFVEQDFTLPAGHLFHRISANSSSGPLTRPTYCTPSSQDFHRYVTAFRKELPGTEYHHITFRSNQPINVPSLAVRLETVKELFGGNKNPDSYYETLYNSWCGGKWEHDTAQKFFAALSAKGYHAIIDDMDAGVIGDRPMVIFDYSAFGEKNSSRLSDEDIAFSESSLIELINRKL